MTTGTAKQYRDQAALDTKLAAEATLPNVRAIHEAAARKWTEMAERAERMAR